MTATMATGGITPRAHVGSGTVEPLLVLTTCPNTGELVPTGRVVSSFDELAAENFLPMCPSCGADHSWSRASATFAAQ